tara:strand:- start:319 stop:546 length:228 start_codon:yes stop_codon:yes gene_type:complete
MAPISQASFMRPFGFWLIAKIKIAIPGSMARNWVSQSIIRAPRRVPISARGTLFPCQPPWGAPRQGSWTTDSGIA